MAKGFQNVPAPAQAAIIIAVTAALAGVVFYLEVWPLSAKIDGLKRDIQKLKADNDRNEAFRREQTEYLNRIAQLEKQLQTLRSIVPDEPAVDDFIRLIFNSGHVTGVNIRTFVAQAAVVRELFVELPFNLRLDGTYYAMLSYFDRLAHQQRIVSVSNLGLGSPQGGGMGNYLVHPSETVGANCTVITYFNKPASAAPAQPAQVKR